MLESDAPLRASEKFRERGAVSFSVCMGSLVTTAPDLIVSGFDLEISVDVGLGLKKDNDVEFSAALPFPCFALDANGVEEPDRLALVEFEEIVSLRSTTPIG